MLLLPGAMSFVIQKWDNSIENGAGDKSWRAVILVELRCYYGDGVRLQPGRIQHRLRASNQTHLLHCQKTGSEQRRSMSNGARLGSVTD